MLTFPVRLQSWRLTLYDFQKCFFICFVCSTLLRLNALLWRMLLYITRRSLWLVPFDIAASLIEQRLQQKCCFMVFCRCDVQEPADRLVEEPSSRWAALFVCLVLLNYYSLFQDVQSGSNWCCHFIHTFPSNSFHLSIALLDDQTSSTDNPTYWPISLKLHLVGFGLPRRSKPGI